MASQDANILARLNSSDSDRVSVFVSDVVIENSTGERSENNIVVAVNLVSPRTSGDEVSPEETSVSDESDISIAQIANVLSPILSGTSMVHLMQSVALPSRVVVSALRTPFRIAMRGKRRPTWSTEMEIVVSAFRSACRNAPRDLSLLRAWTDISIPALLLPKGAIRHSTRLHGMKVEWVFPHTLTPWHGYSSARRIRSSLFSNEQVIEWSRTHPIVLYIHGGAFCLCGSNTHRNIVCSFAMQDLVLFVPNYRRPPDVSIMHAVDDCYASYKHLVEVLKIPPARIAIMGDSAGGALAILTMCKIRDLKAVGLPACSVVISPWCDLGDAEIAAEAAKGTIMPEHDYLPFDAIVMISKLVVGEMSVSDPRINPMHANLAGLPKLLIHVGQVELLFNQIVAFYDKCRDDSVDVRMTIWTDMVHVPHTFTHVSEIARLAVEEAAKFIKLNIGVVGS